MNKVTKIFIVAACFVALVAGVLLLPVTREFAARWALEWLAGKLDARAGFERVSIGWRGDVRFDELYFVDNQGDTILRGDVGVGFKLGRRVEVRRVAVSDGWADISLIVSRLRGNGGAKIAAIELRRMNVVYDTLRADRVGLNVRDFVADNGDISLNLKKLRFNYREHSVEVSVPRLAVEKKILTADGACVSIDDSRLFFEKFRYNFPAKKFETAIENSAVKLCGITFNNLNISAFGTMDDISAQVAFSSKEAVLRASGRLRPREKSFDVRVDSLAADARIVDIFVRKPLSDTLQTMLGRLGHVSLKGDFGGRNGDFKVDATVSTSLGLVNLTGLFSGDYKSQADVTIEQFDLGHLFMIKDLGRATASARIYGRTAEIKINNIDYKAYDYQHITAPLEKKNGDLSVQAVSNDPALSAIFDLEGRNFALNVARADLRAMNFDRRGKPSVLGFAAHGTLGRMMRAEFDNIRYINHLDTISVRKTSLFRSGERLEISSDMSLLGALVPGLRSTGNSSFTFTKNRGEAEFFLRAQRLERGDGVLQNLRIDGVMHTDTIALDGGFDIGQQRWALASKEIVFRDKSFIINDFALDGSGQKIRVNGVASSNRVARPF